MTENLVLTHAQLEATRMMLWSLALEAEAKDNYKDRDTLLDAMDLVIEEMIRIELTAQWEGYVNGTSEVK